MFFGISQPWAWNWYGSVKISPCPEPGLGTATAVVRIEVAKGRQTLTISNLDKLAEPESYLQLKEQVEALLPPVDLPEVLLESKTKTGFMDEFTYVNESFARVRDLFTSIVKLH